MTLDQIIKSDLKDTGRSGTSIEERLFLYSMVRVIKPKKVIEIGTFKGHSACWLALAMAHNKQGRLICVDDWKGTNGGCGGTRSHAESRLKKYGLTKIAMLFKMDSHKFMNAQENDSAEIVWVDGRHDYEGQAQDIKDAIRVSSHMVIVHDAFNLAETRQACEDIGDGVWIKGFRGMWMRSKW